MPLTVFILLSSHSITFFFFNFLFLHDSYRLEKNSFYSCYFLFFTICHSIQTMAATDIATAAPSTTSLPATPTEVSAFLGRELRVSISDGRVAVGTLVAFQGSGDLLLQKVLEQRRLKDGLVVVRRLNLLAIPFKHLTALHRRKEGEPPLFGFEEEDDALKPVPT